MPACRVLGVSASAAAKKNYMASHSPHWVTTYMAALMKNHVALPLRGRTPVIPKEVEQGVVKKILEASDRGFGIARLQLFHTVAMVAVKCN